MALEIINRKIVGTIDNLQEKLEGKLPVDRLELLYLVNSWGRNFFIYIKDTNDYKTRIAQCKIGNCYDLSRLDTSKITNMDSLFENTSFDGDISQWNVSKVTSMKNMFSNAINFNQSLNSWDTSKVTDMNSMFSYAYKFNNNIGKWDVSNVTNMCGMFDETENFNQNISNWNVSNVTSMSYMFYDAKAFNQNISSWNFDNIISCDYMFYNAKGFKDRYNSGKPLPEDTDDIKTWININRDKMNEIDIKETQGEELDCFFLKFDNTYSQNNNFTNIHSKN